MNSFAGKSTAEGQGRQEGDSRGEDRHQRTKPHAVPQRVEELLVMQCLPVPLQGEAFPRQGGADGVVEGHGEHRRHGQIDEDV